jgi:HPt (histidine-containing phosphotransfer) domain-containing protein
MYGVTLFSDRAPDAEQRPVPQPLCPSFDLATLLELFDGDDAEVTVLLEAAIGSIRSDARTIAGAAGKNDCRTVLASAHRLKGTSGTIGDRRLFAISIQIEETAAGIPDAPLLSALHEAVDVLTAEISAYALRPVACATIGRPPASNRPCA